MIAAACRGAPLVGREAKGRQELGDPGIYAYGGGNVGRAIPDTSAFVERAARSAPEPVDVFAVPRPEPIMPVLAPVERTLPDRLQWLQLQVPVERPPFGEEIVPEVFLFPSNGHVEDVRLTLLRDDAPVTSLRIPALPENGAVRIDFRERRVYSSSHGVERVNWSLARAGDGSRLVWPKSLPNSGTYSLVVDRAAGNPVEVDVLVAGRAQP